MNSLLVQPTTDQAVIYQVNMFLEYVANTKSSSTAITYTAHTNTFLAWLQDQNKDRGLKSLIEAYKSHISIKYESARSKNLALSIVRSLFKYLFEEGIIDNNPAATLKNFNVSDGHTKSALDKYQLHDLLEYLKNDTTRNRALLTLAVSNGLRANEVANILIEDFDIKDSDCILWLLRKGYDSKDNYTILTPATHALLMEYKGDRTEGYLFQSQKGGGLSTSSISKLAKKIFRAIGIDSKAITMHSCRHTFGRLCIEAGVNITHVMQALNHKHLSSTQVYYRAYDRSNNAAEKAISIYE